MIVCGALGPLYLFIFVVVKQFQLCFLISCCANKVIITYIVLGEIKAMQVEVNRWQLEVFWVLL